MTVLLLSLQFHEALRFLWKDETTKMYRVDAVHLAIALHQEQALGVTSGTGGGGGGYAAEGVGVGGGRRERFGPCGETDPPHLNSDSGYNTAPPPLQVTGRALTWAA